MTGPAAVRVRVRTPTNPAADRVRITGVHDMDRMTRTADGIGDPPDRGTSPPTGPTPEWVVLVLHGGRQSSTAPTRPWQLAYQRMIPLARTLHRAVAGRGTAVWQLRNRVRGWNEPERDAVVDARVALAEIRRRHRDARVVVVGHSMGGRAALRIAGDERVEAVCALAPWIEDDEPVAHLSGCSVLLAHGDRDRTTSPTRSAEFATRARAAGCDARFVRVRSDGHAMVRRGRFWSCLVRDFVVATVQAGTAVQEGRR